MSMKLKIVAVAAFILLVFSGIAYAAESPIAGAAGDGLSLLNGWSDDNAVSEDDDDPADDGDGDDSDDEGDSDDGDENDDDGDGDEEEGNHGEEVSAVAKDKDAVGTKVMPNGKEIENHGMAVREVAHGGGDNGGEDGDEDDSGGSTGGDHSTPSGHSSGGSRHGGR